jgi:hypothetical protein
MGTAAIHCEGRSKRYGPAAALSETALSVREEFTIPAQAL